MAPVTYFLKVGPNTAVPLRVFINKKSIKSQIFQETETFQTILPLTNTKTSLIKLKNSRKLRISQRELSKILKTFQKNLIKILLKLNIEELSNFEILHKELDQFNFIKKDHHETKHGINEGSIKIPLKSTEGYEVLIMIKPNQLNILRSKLLQQDTEHEKEFFGSYLKLLLKITDFEFNVKEEEEDDEFTLNEIDENVDRKSKLKVNYHSVNLLTKGITIIILKRP